MRIIQTHDHGSVFVVPVSTIKGENSSAQLTTTDEEYRDSAKQNMTWDYDEKEIQAAANDAAHYLRKHEQIHGINLERLVEVAPTHWHTWFGRGSTYERKSRDLAHLEYVPSLCRNAYLYFYPIQRYHTECGWGVPFQNSRAILTWDRVVIASSHRHDEPDFLHGRADIKLCTVMSVRTHGNAGGAEYCRPYKIGDEKLLSEHEAEL